MSISTQQVKELRERTGLGMMECKTALQEAQGDMEAASDLLHKKAGAKIEKRAGRIAADGAIGLHLSSNRKLAAMVEVNSETDFVAKNEQFQDFVRNTTQVALGAANDDVDALKGSAYPGGGTVADTLTNNVATIGENQQVRRMKSVAVSSGLVVPYMHNAAAPLLGKIGVLVALESEAGADVLEPLGKQIAMHIAAAFPQALSSADLDPVVLERERKIALEKAVEEAAKSGKEIPADILAKRADGAAAKFAKDNALLSQVFVMDNKTPVAQVVEAAGKAAGTKIVLKDYVRFQLGEGIEKKETDFAAEVAAAAGLQPAQ
ncbi:MAG: translation elongation factor Ts [Novosphingobium sp.]|nr:translation elongation factor Ts [Novosphingobium sp.]